LATSPKQSQASSTPLPPGTRAPPFTVPASPDNKKISLKDCLGSPVVLVFYPADFTPVCTSELALFNELLPEFQRFRAQVFGISCDSVWSHIAFAREQKVHFPLLSDFHPKGEVSRQYRVYREQDGISERALFVIDGEGKVFWSYVSPMDVNPGADGVLDALERMAAQQPPQREAHP
jgi:peroxiredoxin